MLGGLIRRDDGAVDLTIASRSNPWSRVQRISSGLNYLAGSVIGKSC